MTVVEIPGLPPITVPILGPPPPPPPPPPATATAATTTATRLGDG